MKSLGCRVMESLEKEKLGYKYVFYDPKKDQFRLVLEARTLVPQNRDYYHYYDGDLWGKDIWIDKTKHWQYLGVL